ncbi:MAG: bacterial Ig-like domain-containing protein, partial [Herbinix sp.]|nr:bacterial Ig-like domain-containing protein [Herbinix sp.]
MKRKLLLFIITIIAVSCFYNSYFTHTAKAEEIETDDNYIETIDETVPATLNSMVITQYPSKVIYNQGDSLDFSDMIVEGYYSDGTISAITDYEILGYDSNLLGNQTITIRYQEQSVSLSITVLPAKITNVTVVDHSTSSFTLTWDAMQDAVRYEIYCFDSVTGSFVLTATSQTNSITLYYPSTTVHSFQICAIKNMAGTEYKSEFSDTLVAATAPEAVTGLTKAFTTTSSVSLTWDDVYGATGYIVYRAKGTSTDYTICTITSETAYTDESLSSGQGYQYKVSAYTYDKEFDGEFSSILDTSTNPAKVTLKYKAGEQKVKITYTKVTGASYYDIYIGDDLSGYTLLTSRIASYKNYFIAEGLTTGNTYTFYAVARRKYKGGVYESPESDRIAVEITEIEATSANAKLFATKEEFLNSWTYTKLNFFSKNVKFTKSYIIPGLVTTNVGGFSSTTMCPQGITFAGNYLLQTAYDISGEENSVIYVIDKTSKNLLTTLVLPSKTHVGGICYDGTNIWIPTGTKISSIPFTEIEDAVAAGQSYTYINYNTTSSLGITASFLTYYREKIWVGSYNELEATNMYSYTIDNKDTEPSLTQTDTIVMPTRVQSAVFTSQGTLILSRSCQLYKGLRGYIRQLDVYRPNFASETNGIIALGNVSNTIEMPSMNEGIA